MTVDVRVVDRQGRPVAGLTAADFTVEDGGERQTISHFAPVSLTPQEAARTELSVNRPGVRPADVAPSRRVFLILLGRGDLQIPSKGLDGVIHLVRNLLLPQDHVAVMAWNRATPFTTQHEEVAAVLERYAGGYRKVEALLAQHFSGLAAVYGSRDIPVFLQKDIDEVLRGPGGIGTRPVLPDEAAASAVVERINRETNALLDNSTRRAGSLDIFGQLEADRIGMSLNDYVSNSVQSTQDLMRLYAGLGYLRHIDGEKRIIYVSPCGLGLPSADDDKSIARMAQDARVAVDIFHSGGLCGMWSVASSQNIAEFSGGHYTGVTYGTKFLERVDAATRTGYQLGYYPTRPAALDGKYRKVNVNVRRRGVEVLYRHGYYDRADLATLDPRQVMTQGRVEAALRYGQPVRDLKVEASARRGRTKDGKLEMVVQLVVAPDGIAWVDLFMEKKASLDVMAFCVDRGRYLVGQMWRTVDLRLDDAKYVQFKEQGVGFTVHVPLRRSATDCKAVVYDYAADKVGTAVPRIR